MVVEAVQAAAASRPFAEAALSLRIGKAKGREPHIYIPQDHNRGSLRKRTIRATRWLWSRGIYPGPSAVTMRLHGRSRRDLNGVETKARNETMIALGITRQRPGWFKSSGQKDPVVLGSWSKR